MITYFKHLLDILFPPVCFACEAILEEERGGILCRNCEESILPNTAFTCPVCRGRVSFGRRCHKSADYILFAYSSYSNPALRALIWQVKFRRRSSAAAQLAKFLYNSLLRFNPLAREYIIVPTPLHPSRMRERGFNQAELIANEVGRHFQITVIANALTKTRKTKPQTETKDRDERRANLRDCFRVIKPELVAGKNILLIDDVWTSGATMNEAAHALKLAGASKIIGLVLAKAG